MSRHATRNRDIETMRGDELAAPELTRRQVRNAALTICDRATSPDDARMLLEACGLIRYPRGEFATYSYGRVKTP